MYLLQKCQNGWQKNFDHNIHPIPSSRGWNKGTDAYEDAANSVFEGPKYICIVCCCIIQQFRQYKLDINADTSAGTNAGTNADTEEHTDSSASANTDNATNDAIDAATYGKTWPSMVMRHCALVVVRRWIC